MFKYDLNQKVLIDTNHKLDLDSDIKEGIITGRSYTDTLGSPEGNKFYIVTWSIDIKVGITEEDLIIINGG